MQLPYRKPGKYTNLPNDPMMTGHKFAELHKELDALKKKQPQAASEVARLAELGDFSENVEYQQAKGRLRGILNAITKIEFQLNQAEIIEPNNSGVVEIGSRVTVQTDGKKKTFTILGSLESDPGRDIISYTSPLGGALLGKKVGENVHIGIKETSVEYLIVDIS